MKFFVFILLVAEAALQVTNAQCIRDSLLGLGGLGPCSGPCISPCASPYISPCASPYISPCASPYIGPCSSPCAPMIAAPTVVPSVIQTSSVASSLADTLSLLTVSSLLADTLPLGPDVVVGGYGCGCGLGGCGCGLGGYGGYYY